MEGDARDEPDGMGSTPSDAPALSSPAQTSHKDNGGIGVDPNPGDASSSNEPVRENVAQFDGRLIDCSDVDNVTDQQDDFDEDDSDSLNEAIDLDLETGPLWPEENSGVEDAVAAVGTAAAANLIGQDFVPDKSFIKSFEDEMADEGVEMADEGEEISDRNRLYEKATEYERRGKKDIALRDYLRCLTGLADANNGFRYLPQCLHRIAGLYYEKEEFDKAIQFIQAEKMYYETALIDISKLQKNIDKTKKSEPVALEEKSSTSEEDSNEEEPEGVRAKEYEKLAQLCMEKEQPQMALEYQGKATKLRQNVYGEQHPLTLKSLDKFTMVYAEVGKQQYSDSMQKLTEPATLDSASLSPSESKPQSILRNRKESSSGRAIKKQVSFDESVEEHPLPSVEAEEIRMQEDWISHTLLLIMFAIGLAIIFLLGFYVYCKLGIDLATCRAWKNDVYYYYMRFKYFFYYYTSSKKDTYG